MQANHWYHVAGVATADGEMRLFVDGQEEGTSVDCGALRQKLDRYFIGSATGDGMGMFEGSIAEVRSASRLLMGTVRPGARRRAVRRSDRDAFLMRQVRLWNYAQSEDEIKDNMRVLLGTGAIRRLLAHQRGPGGMVFDHSSYGNPARSRATRADRRQPPDPRGPSRHKRRQTACNRRRSPPSSSLSVRPRAARRGQPRARVVACVSRGLW